MLRSTRAFALSLLAAAALAAHADVRSARADVPAERPGRVETLPRAGSPHWVWAVDLLLERTALVDLDERRFLGMLNGGYGPIAPLFAPSRGEIYIPSTFYSRRTRGERTDVVVIHDTRTLAPVGEVEVPPKRALDAVALGHNAISDDERFLAMFNLTPASSLSIVDAQRRAFTAEIAIPGCSLVYSAGPRRFLSLCGDGSALLVGLDEDGREVSKVRTRRFFDPIDDPITEKAARSGDVQVFVSFEGHVHTLDVSGPEVRFGEVWSLVDDGEREDRWRIGGVQHLAVHRESGRLYALMHQGGPDTHKEPGDEVWVFDLETGRRIQRVALRHPGFTFMGFPVEIGEGWMWPFGALAAWLVDSFAPPMVGMIEVTQDDAPRLVTASQFFGSLGVYDALSGEFLGRVPGVGMTTDILQAPWSGEGG